MLFQLSSVCAVSGWGTQEPDWVKLVYSALIFLSGSSGGEIYFVFFVFVLKLSYTQLLRVYVIQSKSEYNCMFFISYIWQSESLQVLNVPPNTLIHCFQRLQLHLYLQWISKRGLSSGSGQVNTCNIHTNPNFYSALQLDTLLLLGVKVKHFIQETICFSFQFHF